MVSDSDSDDDHLKDEATSSKKQSNVVKKKPVRTKLVKLDIMPSDNLNNMPDSKKLEYIRRPTRPVRLFSFTDRDILNRFSKTTESSKKLAMQLLNIVKSVNMSRRVKIENGTVVPNFYIMATKCESQGQKITEMDSVSIVNLVKDIIHMIKIGMYRKVDFVEVICDSPAIFLIKYINVKNWDPVMNAVYVVTSEYLLPYMCKIKAAEEQEEKAKLRLLNSGKQPQISSKRKKSNSPVVQELMKRKKSTSAQSKNLVTEENTVSVDLMKKTNTVTKTQSKPTVFGEICSKLEEETVEAILSKYLEPDAVQFFITQMKVSGKTCNQYRWKDKDKLLALKLLRNDPAEYSVLFQKFTLPSDKTLEKYLSQLKKKREYVF